MALNIYLVNGHATRVVLVVSLCVYQLRRQRIFLAIVRAARGRARRQVVSVQVYALGELGGRALFLAVWWRRHFVYFSNGDGRSRFKTNRGKGEGQRTGQRARLNSGRGRSPQGVVVRRVVGRGGGDAGKEVFVS